MNIGKHTVASFNFTLKNDSGEVIDTSEGQAPMTYLHGTDTLLPALEAALDGKAVGDKLELRLEAGDAYGERDEEQVHVVARGDLPPDEEMEVGMQLEAVSEEGTQVVTIVGIEGDEVILDGNHPLAGVALNFELEVVETRPATEEEISHGHLHGPGGHQH